MSCEGIFPQSPVPLPILETIFLHLDAWDLESCELVCRSWNNFLRKVLYRNKVVKDVLLAKFVPYSWGKKKPRRKEFHLDGKRDLGLENTLTLKKRILPEDVAKRATNSMTFFLNDSHVVYYAYLRFRVFDIKTDAQPLVAAYTLSQLLDVIDGNVR